MANIVVTLVDGRAVRAWLTLNNGRGRRYTVESTIPLEPALGDGAIRVASDVAVQNIVWVAGKLLGGHKLTAEERALVKS